MIPFVDLRAQYATIRDDVQAAIARVLESGQFVLGPEVAAFEEEFAAFCGVPHAIGVNSGTSALHLALIAAGVGPADEVITVPFTFVASVAAVGYTGARAVFVDVDPVSYTMDVRQVERVITARTKAIIPVHLYGQPVDLDPLLELAARHRVTVIEDACQAHGVTYKGRRVGTIGHFGCFSFYPTKILGAYGEGGLIVTGDDEQARALRLLRDWGQQPRHRHVRRGFNYRLEAVQGAILRVKLQRLAAWIDARRACAARYDEWLAGVGVESPTAMPYGRHVYTVYAIRCQHRDMLREALGRAGVETAVHYPTPVHLEPAYGDLGYRQGDFPVAEQLAREVLSLPIYAELSERDQRRIVEVVHRAVPQRVSR
jgi:dTDP-4-amino-4,6-dideoxygalactose transaminase